MKQEKYSIKFIGLDEKEYTFKAELNKLTNNWIYTLNDFHQCFVGNLRDVKREIKTIRENCKIISENK
jgi:hypothetical protein